VDGSVEEALLPRYLVAEQPVPPFAELRAIRHQATPSVWAEVRFSGDVFEMEDQRNWTDASFKTFCTPLRLPYPVEIAAGSRVQQAVTVRLDGVGGASSAAQITAPDQQAIALDIGTPGPMLPNLGLGMASHGVPLSHQEVARLAALNLSHLRADLALDGDWEPVLVSAMDATRRLGVHLELALLLPTDAEPGLAALGRALARLRPPVIRWLIYCAQERMGQPTVPAEQVSLARHLLTSYAAVQCGSGTNTDFIFFNRVASQLDGLDLLALTINPQVHAFDNASLVETLEAQAALVESARRLAGDLPICISPVTLKPRFNPYATAAPPPTPAGELPPQVDPRQMSLFGAGWTLGSLKYLAESGVASITYYETTGWRGVMEQEEGAPLPERFPSTPGGVFPLYHVLADAGEFGGGQVQHSRSSDPLSVEVLALSHVGRRRLLIANLTDRVQPIHAPEVGGSLRLRLLDGTTAQEAIGQPERFRQRWQTEHTGLDGLCLQLRPYAVATVDVEAG
jgi:hypothetical protein